MESLLADIAALKNDQRLLAARMDGRIQRIRDIYEPQLAARSQILTQLTDLARRWGEAHPEEFGGARSIDMGHGVVGWRLAPPALKTVDGWSWDLVKNKLKSLGATAYIRAHEEVNKQSLLADRDRLGPEKLREMGLRVEREDAFFVEPKLTEKQPEACP